MPRLPIAPQPSTLRERNRKVVSFQTPAFLTQYFAVVWVGKIGPFLLAVLIEAFEKVLYFRIRMASSNYGFDFMKSSHHEQRMPAPGGYIGQFLAGAR